MLHRPPRWHVAIPIALGALVIALAVLQYRWLGQVSDAERQELRASLERRAQECADEINTQIGQVYSAFAEMDDAESRAALAAAIGKAMSAWHGGARFPRLVQEIYVVEATGSHDTIDRFDMDTKTLKTESWPMELAPILPRLSPQGSGSFSTKVQSFTQVIVLGGVPLISRVPALLIWLNRRDLPPEEWTRVPLPIRGDLVANMPRSPRALVIRLSSMVIARDVLPKVIGAHFGITMAAALNPIRETRSPRLPAQLFSRRPDARIQVVDADDALVVASRQDDERISRVQADVAVPLLIPKTNAPEDQSMDRFLAWGRGAAPPAIGDRFTMQYERREIAGDVRVRVTPDAWQLRIQHGDGSLDQAVANARRRNLYLSFGILSVLVAAMALVLVNTRRSERLAAQQMEFVATVSHELRTPVAVIRSAAENLAAGIVQEPAQARQYGAIIETEGRRLTDMVEQVLAHAGINGARRSGPTADVDVGRVVRDAVTASMPALAQAGVEPAVTIEGDLPIVKGDEASLRRAIENLIVNVTKHAAAGRWVGISARRAPVGDSRLMRHDRKGRVTITQPVEFVEIAVADRGPGIDDADRAHLFEPFYRGRAAVERQVQGSGLGLSLTKRTVEDLGGAIRVESPAEGGALFVLTIPAGGPPA